MACIVLGTFYHITAKRLNMNLIEAIQAGDFESACILASKGYGIDAKTSKDESALILALKTNRPDVAHNILDNIWVTTHVRDAKGISAIQIAAVNGDLRTLALLLKKGEMIRDIQPAAISQLIRKGDMASLKFIVDKGFILNDPYVRPSYGDQAVLEGQTEIIRFIQKHNGPFAAPAAFVALATNDAEALRQALEAPKAISRKFRGYTLERFAEKIGRQELLALCIKES